VVVNLSTGKTHQLQVGYLGTNYVPTGHLLFGSSGTLKAVPFDISTFEVMGVPEAVVEDMALNPNNRPLAAVSENGVLAYLPGPLVTTLVAVDRQGNTTELVSEPGSLLWPRYSPDGRTIAATQQVDSNQINIWLYDLERGTRTRVTGGGANVNPTWTPDGRQLTYGVLRFGSVYAASLGSTTKAELLIGDGGGVSTRRPLDWSADGQVLVFKQLGAGTGSDIWLYRKGKGIEPLLASEFNEDNARFSSDGRLLAYVSDESGRNEVYVCTFPEVGAKWVVSAGGGQGPVWSPNREELYYRELSGRKIFSVPVSGRRPIQIGAPDLIFEGDFLPGPHFDLAPDGEHFLLTKISRSREINIVLNWFEELKRLCPTE
jgi:WD40 repeat protein